MACSSVATPQGGPHHARHHRRRIPYGSALVLHPPRPIPFAHEGTLPAIRPHPPLPARSLAHARQFIQDADNTADVLPALYLLGLLVNYNKFEFQNPYKLRLDDFVNDAIIQKIVASFGDSCVRIRDAYVAVQEDMPEPWSLGSTLNYIGLGVLSPTSRPSTPTPGPEESKSLFAALYVT